MSLRFIYGKSGTGKTSLCFNQINNLIKENKKVYIITPEQFSFSAEKHLMKVLKNKAVMCAEVITFKRIAHRIINSEGNAAKENITNCGKAMLLSYIMEKQKNNLKFLGKTDKNLDLSLRMITELKKNNIDDKLLNERKEKIDDKYIKLKLEDISILYEEFNNVINSKYLDDDDLLSIVKEKVCKSDMFKETYIFIDEFAGFTKQEYSIIEELLKEANEVNITMCTDSLESMYNSDTDIFAPNKKTIQKLKEIALKNNIKIAEPIKLEKTYRFKSNELEYLSNNLYETKSDRYLKENNAIKLFLANNNYTEVEYVANNITELVRDNGYRYKDISVITKNTDDYSSLIKSIFKKYNIPVFIDEKKDLNQNILVKYLISLLEVYSKSFSMEAVINYIKTGFIDLEDEEIYQFENYCKKIGINGVRKFTNKFEINVDGNSNIEELNCIKDKIINPLLKLKENLNKDKTIKAITLEIYTFLEKNNIREVLQNKITAFEEMGNIELANIYNTSWNLLIDILDELVLVLGDEKISFENYINLLKVGINNSSLGKIPATLDEVIVGDVDRSRSEDKKAVFIIGINDGKFPSNSKNEGFINDEERIYLKEKGLELAKTTKEQVYDENFNIYKAFSVAEEKLYLSYSASDNDGKGLRKSILLNKIKKIFPDLKEESDIIEQKTYVSSKDVTFDLLLLNLRKYLDGEKIDNTWFRIYDIYMQDELYKEKLIVALNGFNYTNIPNNLNESNIQKLYGDSFETSISKLESYRRCPFSYYLKYGLKLSENTELKLQNMDTGTFMHEVIDEFFSFINKEEINLKEISEEEIEKIVKEIVENKLNLSKNYVFNAIPKYIVLSRRLKKVITNAIKYIINTLKYSDFKLLGTEIEFGKGKSYEPIEVNLENGKKVQIIGKIDRVDIAENKDGKYIRIIDYKSSVKNVDLNEVVAGIQIQLLTYLDAVSKKEEAIPAGTLYFNLIEPVIKAKNKHLTDEQLEQEIRNNFKMNGLILGDVNVVKMMDNNLVKGNSNMVPAYIDKDGNLSKNKTSVLEKNDFKKLQIKIEKIIKEISQNILTGQIQQKPIYLYKNKKTACDYCNFKAICGFNSKMCGNNYNYIPNASKTEILEKL
mgnify:CR=1 FL=1